MGGCLLVYLLLGSSSDSSSELWKVTTNKIRCLHKYFMDVAHRKRLKMFISSLSKLNNLSQKRCNLLRAHETIIGFGFRLSFDSKAKFEKLLNLNKKQNLII
eukprot:Selendium_serpulae@DN6372_c0_g1_i20.p1